MCFIFDILFVADKEKEMGGVEDFSTILEVGSLEQNIYFLSSVLD